MSWLCSSVNEVQTKRRGFCCCLNGRNLFIESYTLRDALRFRICIKRYPLSQIKFLCTIYFCVLCDEKENSEFNLSF